MMHYQMAMRGVALKRRVLTPLFIKLRPVRLVIHLDTDGRYHVNYVLYL